MNERLQLFLSHISEEANLAFSVKTLIENAFLGLVDVFVSSDPDSIAYGQRWLEQVTVNLKSCVVELILCSPVSIQQPWINFEAGAGWVRDIPVIPLCHSGLTRDQLPVPLSLLQAANLSDFQDVNGALKTISSVLGSNTPTVDLTTFISQVKSFEVDYTFWSKFASAYSFGVSYLAKSPVINQFLNGQTFTIEFSETAINDLRRGLGFFISQQLITIERTGESIVTGNGAFFGTQLTFTEQYNLKLQAYLERLAQQFGPASNA